MTEHALFSASAASRWINCAASLKLAKQFPSTSNSYADEGTCAHEVAAQCLRTGQDAIEFVDRVFSGVTFDEDMAEDVQSFVDDIRALAEGHTLMIEQRVYYGKYISQPDELSFGTADAIILMNCGTEVQIRDLKFGKGVPVPAKDNEQLRLYALGTLDLLDMLGAADGVKHVRIGIHQPRIGNDSEWVYTVQELLEFAEHCGAAAKRAMEDEPPFTPGEKQCRFCPAKGKCKAYANFTLGNVIDDFDDLDNGIPPIPDPEATTRLMTNAQLGAAMDKVDMIEKWCTAIRAQVETELLSGRDVPGYKLVTGRKGQRKWIDSYAVIDAMKSMRLRFEDMYTFKLISPAQAEKLLKKEPRRWARLAKMFEQTDGPPSVAPAGDKREAIRVRPATDDFDDLNLSQPKGD